MLVMVAIEIIPISNIKVSKPVNINIIISEEKYEQAR